MQPEYFFNPFQMSNKSALLAQIDLCYRQIQTAKALAVGKLERVAISATILSYVNNSGEMIPKNDARFLNFFHNDEIPAEFVEFLYKFIARKTQEWEALNVELDRSYPRQG